MSDISIPGVSNSRFNTQKMIDDLMKLERIPLNRLEGRVETFKKQKVVWQQVNRSIGRLESAAKTLYGFQNPFQNRTGSSSDDSILTASATREAVESTTDIEIIQTAQADRFLSRSIDKDFAVPEGTYGFTVGDKEVLFRFRGGDLTDFTETLNRRSRDLIHASVIRDTADTEVLLIESMNTGSSNPLSFQDDSITLGLRTGMLKTAFTGIRTIPMESGSVTGINGRLSPESFRVVEEGIIVSPQKSLALPFTPPVDPEEDLVLEIKVQVKNLDREEWSPPAPPTGPEVPAIGSITHEGITIHSAGSDAPKPPWTPSAPPEVIDNLEVLYIAVEGKETALPALKDSEEVQTLTIPLKDLGTLLELRVRNRNTYREIEILNVRVYDPNARGEYRPGNSISEARDAKILLEGIEVTRESNIVDDLLPGVTFELHKPGEATLKVEPDRESVKDSIITFIGYYNRLLSEITVLTSDSEDLLVLNELEYLSDEDQAKMEDQLGLFQGETMFTQMKSRLQRIMMNPYPTIDGREISLLAHIGISTNVSGSVGSLDTSKLRGYIEIEEEKLDEALKSHLPAIKELFGVDTDEDLIVDTGVAFSIETYLRPYSQTGGIIAGRMSGLDRQISRTGDEISSLETRLERTEQDLRRKYGMMEGMIEAMESNSRAIQNLNSNQSD